MKTELENLIASIPEYKGKRFLPIPFTYELDFAALAPAGVANAQITFQNDADFVILAQTYYASAGNTIQAATFPVPNMSILLNDSGSGKNLSSLAVPVPSWFGTGQFPFVLPAPYLWAKKSVMNATLTNNDGASTYTLKLSFHGVKLSQVG